MPGLLEFGALHLHLAKKQTLVFLQECHAVLDLPRSDQLTNAKVDVAGCFFFCGFGHVIFFDLDSPLNPGSNEYT